MSIKVINITEDLQNYQTKIIHFLRSLNSEKKFFFSINKKKIFESDIVHVALDGNAIAGIAGLDKTYGIKTSYVMIKNDYQGKGIGKLLRKFQILEGKKQCSVIMSVVGKENSSALKLYFGFGALKAGSRNNQVYLFEPLNKRGYCVYLFFKIMFPIIKLSDFFR